MVMTSLTEDEKEIYNHVKDYLKSKPFFILEDIINYLNQRLSQKHNYTKLAITNLIRSLIRKKIIFPGTKLTRDDILTVQKRVEIYDYITAMPGTNINEIIKYLGVGTNQAIWHLKWLKKFEFIRSIREGNEKIYFKKDFDEQFDKIFYYLRKSKVKAIIKAMKRSSSPIKPADIAKKSKIHYNTVQKYLNVLHSYNLLMEIDVEHKKEYVLNLEMFKLVQDVIDKLK